MLDSAFSKCVPPDPSVEFAVPLPPLSSRVASCEAKLLMVEPARLVVCPTEQELLLPLPDVQRLTWEAYMNKKLVRADPGAHIRIFFNDLGHLLGLAKT